MNTEQVRDALVAVIAASVSYPVVWENADAVSVDTVGDFFVQVSIDFVGAKQASMEARPLTRVTGHVGLIHMQREGTGTKALLARVDALNNELKHLAIAGGLQLATPMPGRKQGQGDWFSQEWLVPFWTHD